MFLSRVALFVGMGGYYVMQLILLASSQGKFLVAVEVLMTLLVFFGAAAIASDAFPDNVTILIDGCIVGLSAGWLCHEASTATVVGAAGNTGIPTVFFAINIGLAVLLSCLDVRTQQTRIEHNALAAEMMHELHTHGGSGGAVATGGFFRSSTASSSATGDGDVESGDAFTNVGVPSGTQKSSRSAAAPSSSSSGRQPAETRRLHLTTSPEEVLDGFRVRLDRLPSANPDIPQDVSWDAFSYVEHRVDSSSCHIYTAYWKGRPVILKLIKADRVASPMAVAEFETEASILSRVEHPNIIKFLGSGHHPRRFLILELLDGGTLSHSLGLRTLANNRIVKKKFSYMETLLLAQSLASALDYLHNHWNEHLHVIHRDLKPDNIGWSAEGTLKLFDFGLCACVRKQRDRREQYKLTGNTGTLRYMAPEVALGRQYNASVDTYSFAVIIWQVLRSRVPFREMGKKMYVQEVVLGGKRPPLDRRWPPGFTALLQRCWHDNKEMRPGFGEVLAELQVLLQEARGLGAASMRMKVRHKVRYAKSYFSLAMRRAAPFRPVVVLGLVGALVAGALLAQHGSLEAGSALLVVACTGLYLVLLTYVPGPDVGHGGLADHSSSLVPSSTGHGSNAAPTSAGGGGGNGGGGAGFVTPRRVPDHRGLLHDNASSAMVGGTSTERNLLGNMFSRGRRRHPSVGLIGLERGSGADPFAGVTHTRPVAVPAPGPPPTLPGAGGRFPVSLHEVKVSAFNPLAAAAPQERDYLGETHEVRL